MQGRTTWGGQGGHRMSCVLRGGSGGGGGKGRWGGERRVHPPGARKPALVDMNSASRVTPARPALKSSLRSPDSSTRSAAPIACSARPPR